MTNIESVDLTQSAKDAVLYANTPSYLLEKLKRDTAIRVLLCNSSPQELLHVLREAGPAADALGVARKYVLLVALASSSLPRKWELLSDVDVSDLEWGRLILKMAQAQEIPTNRAFTEATSACRPNEFKWNQPESIGR